MFKMPKIVWFSSGLRIDLARLREEKPKQGYLSPTFNNIMFVPPPPTPNNIHTPIYSPVPKKNPKGKIYMYI